MRFVAILLALLLAAPAGADTTCVPCPPKKATKAKRRPSFAPAAVKAPAPRPLCIGSECACWFEASDAAGTWWAWRECAPVVEPQEPQVVQELQELPLEPAPPVPAPVPTPEPGLRLRLEAWSLAGFSGAADRKVLMGGRISADGPVAHAWAAPVRMFLRLDVSALPGQALDFSSVETFGRSAEMRGGLYVRFAESWPVDQRITTSLVAWGGFATLSGDQVLDHYLRSAGIGVRLAEEVGGAEISVSWCRDEAAGWIGPVGQVCLGGSVPIVGSRGALVLGGNATLNLSRATVSPQRDVFRLWIGASVGDIVSAVRGR